MRRKPFRMTKAMLEMGVWDLWAKQLGLPLYRLLGGTRTQIPVGVSLGIQPSAEATRDLAVEPVTINGWAGEVAKAKETSDKEAGKSAQ